MPKKNYLNSQALPPLLSEEETERLFEIRDKESKDKLLIHNMRLVISIVEEMYANFIYDQDDLISIGTMGLIKAIDTFDLSRNIKFSTYSSRCIVNEINMFLRIDRKHHKVDSLENKVIDYEFSEVKLKDIIPVETNVEEQIIEKEEYLIIYELLNSLPEDEREMVKMYMKRYTEKEIGEKYNLSQSYVSRKIRNILKKLRQDALFKKVDPKKIK